jgi:cytochrome c biogenesis protein CcmG/thiol:disulfide interchange protein DsbE
MAAQAASPPTAGGSYNMDERSFPVKRNTLVITAVLFILAVFAWAGWANYEYRKQAREQLTAPAAQAELAVSPASGAALYTTPLQDKPAPAFTLEDLSGKKVSLADYKGKALLINFWATWCAPCKIETPWLIELRNQYAAQGFEVLGISADDINRDDPAKLSEEKQEIARFVQKMQMPYPVLIEGDSISKSYGGLDVLPASFYVDRNGNVVAAQLGLTSKNEIEANIKKALGIDR